MNITSWSIWKIKEICHFGLQKGCSWFCGLFIFQRQCIYSSKKGLRERDNLFSQKWYINQKVGPQGGAFLYKTLLIAHIPDPCCCLLLPIFFCKLLISEFKWTKSKKKSLVSIPIARRKQPFLLTPRRLGCFKVSQEANSEDLKQLFLQATILSNY